jgi:5-methylcytosine-specific restriction enzyme A
MPTLPLKPCSISGCPELVTSGRCEQHLKESRSYSDAKRGWRSHSYADAAWRKLRILKLKANPFCEIQDKCKGLRLMQQAAAEVDHIITVRERPDLRMVWTNLQSACRSCHSAKTARENNFAGAARIP